MLELEAFDLNLAVKHEWEERAEDDADLYSMAHEVDGTTAVEWGVSRNMGILLYSV